MRNKFVWELVISSALIILLIALLNPFDYGMPPPVQISMTIAFIVLFLSLAGFIYHENVQDEREQLHRYIANRFAYIAGTGVLVAGVVVQSAAHTVDIWLVATLITVIVAKVVGVIYSQFRH